MRCFDHHTFNDLCKEHIVKNLRNIIFILLLLDSSIRKGRQVSIKIDKWLLKRSKKKKKWLFQIMTWSLFFTVMENFRQWLCLPHTEFVSDCLCRWICSSHISSAGKESVTRAVFTLWRADTCRIFTYLLSYSFTFLGKGICHHFYSSSLILLYNEVLVFPIMTFSTTIHCRNIPSLVDEGISECIKPHEGSSQ